METKMVQIRRRIDEAYHSDFVHVNHRGDVSKPIPENEAKRMIDSFPGQWEIVDGVILTAEKKLEEEQGKILGSPAGDGIAVMEFKGDCYNGDIIRVKGPGIVKDVPEKEARRLALSFPKDWKIIEIKPKTGNKIEEKAVAKTVADIPKKPVEKKPEAEGIPKLNIDDKKVSRTRKSKK